MDLFKSFLDNFDLYRLLFLLIQAVAVLFCIVVHELSHGVAAHLLGDPTAKLAGRLSLNPLRHTDPVGFLMMLVAHVGWAKPVPVDMRRFRHPKRDMALTALAGPVSNFILALMALGLGALLLRSSPGTNSRLYAYGVYFLCYIAVLSVSLGLFNLIPVPPLDGSRLLSVVLPDKAYYTLMHYERYLMLAVVALVLFGVLSEPLALCRGWVLRGLCAVTAFPVEVIGYLFGI